MQDRDSKQRPLYVGPARFKGWNGQQFTTERILEVEERDDITNEVASTFWCNEPGCSYNAASVASVRPHLNKHSTKVRKPRGTRDEVTPETGSISEIAAAVEREVKRLTDRALARTRAQRDEERRKHREEIAAARREIKALQKRLADIRSAIVGQ